MTQAHGHDHLAIDAKPKVTEEPGYWVVHDVVATKEGAHLGSVRRTPADQFRGSYGFKPWAELQRTFKRLEGRVLVLGHRFPPEDRLYLGVAKNARADEENHRILYDSWLYREPIPGADVDPRAITANQRIVDNVRNGIPVDNSPGFMFDVRDEAGTWNGVAYDHVQTNLDYEHVALLPDAVGACSSRQGCGLGVDQTMDDKQQEGFVSKVVDSLKKAFPGLERLTATDQEVGGPRGRKTNMETQHQCAADCLAAQRELGQAKDSCKDLAQVLGTDATPAAVAAAVKDHAQRLKAADERLKAFDEADLKARKTAADRIAKAQGDDKLATAYAKLGLDELAAIEAKLPPARAAPHSAGRDAADEDGVLVTEQHGLMLTGVHEEPKNQKVFR